MRDSITSICTTGCASAPPTARGLFIPGRPLPRRAATAAGARVRRDSLSRAELDTVSAIDSTALNSQFRRTVGSSGKSFVPLVGSLRPRSIFVPRIQTRARGGGKPATASLVRKIAPRISWPSPLLPSAVAM